LPAQAISLKNRPNQLNPAKASLGRSGVLTHTHWHSSLTWIDQPDADIDAFVKNSKKKYRFDLRQKLHEWRKTGIVVFENAVNPRLLAQFQADLDHLRAHNTAYDLTVGIGEVTRPIATFTTAELDSDRIRFTQAHTISHAARRLSLTREVAEFLDAVFASPPCVEQSLTFYKGSQQPIHIDYAFVRAHTKLAHLAASWIPLEDVHPDSGPLAYYPGSHMTDISGFFDWGGGSITQEPDSERDAMQFAKFLNDKMQEAGIEPVTYLPKKGDVLLWHGGLAHGGTPINNPGLTRKSYVTHYTSLEAYRPDHMKPDALTTGAYFSEHGGYAFDYPWLTHPAKLPSWPTSPEPAGKRRWPWRRVRF
jgi:ectoine hydroxylase-related dioxygenase (phytanoyl-CoA dioxygenase family)